MACLICYENKALKHCPRCDEGACISCIKKWILSSKDAKCFNCPQLWNYDFLSSIFPKAFLQGEYKEKIKELLFEEENALIPETQRLRIFQICLLYLDTCDLRLKIPFVSMNRSSKLDIMRSEILLKYNSVAYWIYNKIYYDVIIDPDYIEKPDSIERKNKLEKIILKQLEHLNDRVEFINSIIDDSSRDNFHQNFKCPYEKCPGIVVKERCLICFELSCSQCWEKKESGHICDAVKIKNVIEVCSDSRPCPKCHVRIHKYIGCNHIHCNNCNTHFNYMSGKIFAVNTGMNEELNLEREIECEYDIPLENRTNEVQYLNYLELLKIIQMYEELNNVNNLDLRIYYILNMITKERFINDLYYRWRINKLTIEELSLLRGSISIIRELIIENNIEKVDEEFQTLQIRLEEAAEKYGLAKLKLDKSELILRRYKAIKMDKEIDKIIQRYI